jgi:hypothetical protein
MANPEKVILKIVSVKGTCAAGHYVGQEFDLSQDFICISCRLSLLAGTPAWRGVSLGRGSRQDDHCLPRPIQSCGDGTPEGQRVGEFNSH